MGGSDSLPPVLAGIAAAMLIGCLAIPGPLHADYRIVHGDTTIRTQCYWIQRDMLHLCEGGEPLDLSGVRDIETAGMTPLEVELHRDTLRRFFLNISWLGDRESEIVELNDTLVEGLLMLEELEGKRVTEKEIQRFRKKLLGDADEIGRRVISLKGAWEDLRVPERRLTGLARLKSLRFLTWLQSIQELRIFLDTRDPTFRALALEHKRQSAQFDALYVENVLHSSGEPFE